MLIHACSLLSNTIQSDCLGSTPTACATNIFSAYPHEPKHETHKRTLPRLPCLSALTVCTQTTNSSDHCSMYRSAPSMCRVEIGSLVTMGVDPLPPGGREESSGPTKISSEVDTNSSVQQKASACYVHLCTRYCDILP